MKACFAAANDGAIENCNVSTLLSQSWFRDLRFYRGKRDITYMQQYLAFFRKFSIFEVDLLLFFYSVISGNINFERIS